jgi:hypothetical protein
MLVSALIAVNCQQCGKAMTAYRSKIKAGRGKNCSMECRNRSGFNVRHGESRTRLHDIWCHMKTRCGSNPGPASPYYRDRGIRVCDAWRNSYEAFRDWAHANGYAEHLEIDRIDNDGDYSPDNCRWATRAQQMSNTGKRRDAKTSRFKGVSWCANVSKWRAQIQKDGKHRHVGLYESEKDAAKAYDHEARQTFGEFASTNFKE